MKYVNLLIKPASSLCTLRCRYCFYADEAANRTEASYGLMTEETAERLVRSAFESSEPGGYVSFTFQGGEPTVVGLPFFRRFLQLEEQYARPGVQVSHAIQTNGMAVDKDWADFFREHHFLVGLSIDGSRETHDGLRVDALDKGTWNRAVAALGLLQRHKVEVNLLCVVTGSCARSPLKVYNSLKKLGADYLQFIPCLDPMEEPRGQRPWSLTPQLYGKFLNGLFDAWYLDWKSGNYVSIRLFEDFVHQLMGMPPSTCATSGSCGSYFVAEGDGGLYPCDFYVLDQWRIGTVGDTPLETMAKSETVSRFLAEGLRKPDACEACPWLKVCCGGCKRDWEEKDGVLSNYYCPSFRAFFEYAAPRLEEIAQAELDLRRRMGNA